MGTTRVMRWRVAVRDMRGEGCGHSAVGLRRVRRCGDISCRREWRVKERQQRTAAGAAAMRGQQQQGTVEDRGQRVGVAHVAACVAAVLALPLSMTSPSSDSRGRRGLARTLV